MNDALVLTEIAPTGYAVITLNRPAAQNALSRALMAQLSDAVDQLEADPAVRVLILTGAGKGAMDVAVTGGTLDMRKMPDSGGGPGGGGPITSTPR